MNRNATPCALEFAQLGEEPVDAGRVELRGGLVEDDEAGAEGQRPGDLHELPLLDGQITGPRGRVDVDPVLGEQVARAGRAARTSGSRRRRAKRLRNRFSATVRSGTTIDFW